MKTTTRQIILELKTLLVFLYKANLYNLNTSYGLCSIINYLKVYSQVELNIMPILKKHKPITRYWTPYWWAKEDRNVRIEYILNLISYYENHK